MAEAAGAANPAFDTMAEMQRLRGAGFEQDKAEAITRTVDVAVRSGTATKQDLQVLKKDLEATIARSNLTQIMWLVGVLVAVHGLSVFAIFRLVSALLPTGA